MPPAAHPNLGDRPQPAEAVRLWRDGQWLVVEPACEFLVDILRTAGCPARGDHLLEVARSWQPLFDREDYDRSGVLRCPAGLTAAVLTAIRRAGLPVHADPLLTPTLPPDPAPGG